MGGKILTVVCLLSASLWGCRAAKPLGGNFAGADAISQTLFLEKDASGEEPTVSCRALSLYKDASITLKMKVAGDQKKVAHVTVVVSIIKSRCANFRECSFVEEDAFYASYMKNLSAYTFVGMATSMPETLLGRLGSSPTNAQEISTREGETGGGGGKEKDSNNATGNATSLVATESAPASTSTVHGNDNTFTTNESGLFIVYIEAWIHDRERNTTLTYGLHMKNAHGYLSAIDYPALVFYGLMLAVYVILGVAWSVSMCCSYKDLVRLQFWVFAVVILGFLEKVFFVSEYGSINSGEQSSMFIPLAETISAVKRALARVLLIIVCLGFGTVKPRLGDSLMKVIAVGVIYCILAFIDGIVRSRADTYETRDKSQLVTLALLFIMDTIIFYWAFFSLMAVRRTLRLRKNYVKLSMYNHFAYTLIFSLVATLAFIIWVFVEVNFPKGSCLEDWQEVWLRDCFWHFLFCVILIVIMIIWRPSANRNRFAYSLVNDLDQDDEEEDEAMENKNFETVKLRSVSRGDASTPPPVSSTQAEDDLRWVEENLPTTAMDRALPLILDSDEEVMSTKFEASKMN